MKTTIMIFHPDLENGSRVNRTFSKATKEAGFEVRDMYHLYPNFQFDLTKEKSILESSDRIVIQFPIYWYQAPPLLTHWFNTVFQYGWAYGSEGTALQGKEVILVPTFGASEEDYTHEGRFNITVDEVLKPLETIQYHTGLKYKGPFVTTGSLNLSDEELFNQTNAYITYLT